jgi:hypothetical protein
VLPVKRLGNGANDIRNHLIQCDVGIMPAGKLLAMDSRLLRKVADPFWYDRNMDEWHVVPPGANGPARRFSRGAVWRPSPVLV